MNNQERQDLVRQLRDSISDLTAYVSMEPQPKDADDYRWMIKVQEIALAALTAEPVKVPDELTMRDAIRLKLSVDWAAGYNTAIAHCKELSEPIDNTAQQYEALAGWKMVPVEPTDSMIAAGLECASAAVYRRMLAVAPKPEA